MQQKMDGLSLTPSAQVWEKVEMEIAVEKKKKRGIIWFFLAGLLLPGGGWWLSQSFNKATQQANDANIVQPVIVPGREAPKTTIADKTSTPTIDDKKPGPFKANNPAMNGAPHWKEEVRTMSSYVAKKQKLPYPQQSSASLSSVTSKETNRSPFIESGESRLPRTGSAQPSITTNSLDTLTAKTEPLADKPDSTGKKNESKEIALPTIDSALKKKVASAKSWRRQLTINAGRSSYADGSIFKAYSGSRFNALNYLSAGGGMSTPALPANPSKISGGVAFSLVFSLKKNLSQRWELSFGIGYTYASAHQKVGDKKTADTTVQFSTDKALADGFYTNAGTGDYTNRFHFVEVPLNVSFRPSLRLPLYFSTGVSYARLLHTNALTFSSASNLYYQNKENYPRNALSVFSSVQMEFFSKKKVALRTGPFLQYHLTRLRKENNDGIPHLAVIGLKTDLIF